MTDKGYTSASYDVKKNKFATESIVFSMHVPKGTRALAPINNKDEAEFVLARNTSMKITRVREGTINGMQKK